MSDNYLSFNYKNMNYESGTKYRLYADFNGFVINEGTDLTFFNPSNFSHEFMTPQFTSQSYFMGTTQENREFTFPILLKGVTLAEYKNFLRWLDPKSEGILWFDYNANWGYDVKVNSISEGKFTVDPNCIAGVQSPKYNVELTVSFITKNDWASTLVTTVTSTTLPSTTTPRFLNAAAVYSNTTVPPTDPVLVISCPTPGNNTYNFYSYCNTDMYLIFVGVGLTTLNIESSDSIWYGYSGSANSFSLYSEYAIAVDTNNNFVALSNNLGVLKLEPKISKKLTITYTGTSLHILPVVRELI